MDFLKELGYLGFTARLKRLSDAMMHEGRRLYSELDVDIEPNWFVLFKILRLHGPLTVTAIAERLEMSHPSVIVIINKMTDAGYLYSEKDPDDSRKRVLDLTDRALEKLPEYEKVWKAGEDGMKKALRGTQALEFLDILEEQFAQKGFKERTLEQLNAKS